MKQKLYLECYSGISGDMTVAALLDLGADQTVLEEALKSLPLGGFETKVSRVKKAGIDACDFNVVLDHDNHDHDMEYLHGEGKEHEHQHEHSHFFGLFHHHHHDHEHSHEHGHHHHHDHEHRGLNDIIEILNNSRLTERAKDLSIKMFDIIAEAEAQAHGLPKEEVHFHEVGAVDSIVDIAAVAVCLDNLGIDEVIVPVLYEGTGTVRCQHGVLPIPVPAVANIVNANNLNLHVTNTKGEFVTPTGAAIVAAIRTSDVLPEQFKIIKTGIGAGKRNYERPSLLRAMLIEETAPTRASDKDEIVKLESNIDDATGEALGYAMDKLLKAGARDVHFFPVFMKKNRPGYQLNVICEEKQIDTMQRIIFEETTTIGIRILRMERSVLAREIKKLQTSVGEVRIKVCTMPDGSLRAYPEYEDVVAVCQATGKSYQDVYRLILSEL